MASIALVTGGSSGIGRATALMLQESGYTVYELSRSGKGADGISHVSCDVTDPASVQVAVQTVLSEQGRIDVLVNNAGFGVSGAVECTPVSDAHAQFEVNFFGALNCIQAVLPTMRAQRCGHIINISSVAAPIAIPFQAFYSAVKASVNSLTLSLRNEVRPFGVKVCAIQPGDVKTGFTAARKKCVLGADIYGETLTHAISVMEHDELNGMPPSAVAKAVCRAANSRFPKALYTVGAQYKVFCFIAKVLPTTFVNFLVGKIYK